MIEYMKTNFVNIKNQMSLSQDFQYYIIYLNVLSNTIYWRKFELCLIKSFSKDRHWFSCVLYI